LNEEDGMGNETKYSINLQPRFDPLELVDMQALVDAPIIRGGGHER
jgi:hypothetical protein